MMLNDVTIVAIARRHLRAGRVREAEAVMEEWSARQPASSSLHVLQGWLCLIAGRNDEARRLVTNAVEAAPHLAFAYVAMGLLNAADGLRDEAELCWQRALVLDPADCDAFAFLIQSRLQANDAAGAEQVARNAILASPGDAISHFVLAETLLARSEGREEALRLVARGVAIEPDEWRGWLVYGRALTQAGRWPEALARFERALLIRPDEPEVLQALAVACLHESLWIEAERVAKKMVVLSPKQIHGYRVLATAQAAQHRIDDGVSVLLHALRVLPGDLGALMDLANLHRRAGRLEEATTVARQAQALFPTDTAPSYLVAELDLYRGRISEAFESLARLELTKPSQVQSARLPANATSTGGRAVVLTGESLSQVFLLARYAPRLAAMGADVYVSSAQTIEWGGLAGRLAGVTAFIEKLTDAPEDALIEPVICLPSRFGINEESPLWDGPYLDVESIHVEQVRASLSGKPRPWVGIELSGMPDKTVLQSIVRSIRDAGGTAVVLGPGIDSAVVGEPTVWPRVPNLHILSVWVKTLDTVVAADGLTVSIAGPLGVQAHILLGTDCDALWGMDPVRTNWYPSLRLYRESSEGGWSDALKSLQDSLSILGGTVASCQVEMLTDHVN